MEGWTLFKDQSESTAQLSSALYCGSGGVEYVCHEAWLYGKLDTCRRICVEEGSVVIPELIKQASKAGRRGMHNTLFPPQK